MGRAERGGDGGLHVLLGDAHGSSVRDCLLPSSWPSLLGSISVCSGGAKANKKATFNLPVPSSYQFIPLAQENMVSESRICPSPMFFLKS